MARGRLSLSRKVAGAYSLAGHEHPVYRVATRFDCGEIAVFSFAPIAGVLPAFGAFTGGFEVNDSAARRARFSWWRANG